MLDEQNPPQKKTCAREAKRCAAGWHNPPPRPSRCPSCPAPRRQCPRGHPEPSEAKPRAPARPFLGSKENQKGPYKIDEVLSSWFERETKQEGKDAFSEGTCLNWENKTEPYRKDHWFPLGFSSKPGEKCKEVSLPKEYLEPEPSAICLGLQR